MVNQFLISAIVGSVGIFSIAFMFLVFVLYNGIMTYNDLGTTIKKFMSNNAIYNTLSWVIQ